MTYTTKDLYFLLKMIQDAIASNDVEILINIEKELPQAIAFVKQKLVLDPSYESVVEK